MTKLTIDHIISVLALAFLLGFLAILVTYVPRWDLGIVVLVTILLASWDVWQKFGPQRKS